VLSNIPAHARKLAKNQDRLREPRKDSRSTVILASTHYLEGGGEKKSGTRRVRGMGGGLLGKKKKNTSEKRS